MCFKYSAQCIANALSKSNNIALAVVIYVRLGRSLLYNFALSLTCALPADASVSSASPPLNTSPNPSNIANIPGSAFLINPS